MTKEIAHPMRLLRQFSAHHMLFDIARAAFENGMKNEQKNDVIQRQQFLIAIIFSGFAVEALGNLVGERLIKDFVKDYDNLNPVAKIRLAINSLGKQIDRAAEPWITLRLLMSFRNAVAHAKPQNISLKVHRTDEQLTGWQEPPPANLERKITYENAKRAIEAVIGLKEVLNGTVPPHSGINILSDSFGVIPEAEADAFARKLFG